MKENLQFDPQFELEEEAFITNDSSVTYANAWDFKPTIELPQNFQCGGVENAGKFLKVGIDGYVRLTAVEPGTGVSEEYVDLHDQMTLESAIENTASQVADTLKTAKAYTDTNMAVVQEEAKRLENLIDNLDATKAGIDYVSVSGVGTSEKEVSYITIGENEYKLAGSGGVTQKQSDYAQTDSTQVDFIKNKPDLTIYATKSALNTEISNRQVADNTLTDKITALQTNIDKKQDILTAGTNITIVDNVISASGGGDVTKEYVDSQDENVLETANSNLASMSEKLSAYIQEVDAKVGQDENGIYIQIGD